MVVAVKIDIKQQKIKKKKKKKKKTGSCIL